MVESLVAIPPHVVRTAMDRTDFMPMLIAIPLMVGMVFVAMTAYQLRELWLPGVKRFFSCYVRMQPTPAPAAPELISRHFFRPLEIEPDEADRPADRQTDTASGSDPTLARLQVDRTRTALIDTLVVAGWDTATIRTMIKGDNGTIGAEVKAARERLLGEPPRVIPSREHIDGHLVVRDLPMEESPAH